MQVSRLTHSHFRNAYGILCSIMPKLGDRDGLYPTYCRVPCGGSTNLHSHFESELFYIINGSGLMTIGPEEEKVTTGDLIRIPSSATHQLKNIGTNDLIFLSVYSEDFATCFLPNLIIITSAPPTPNGPLHLGHISGPYLASDIIARYLRLRSLDVWTHTGTDDHQNYIHEKAYSRQMAPENFRNQMRLRIQKGFEALGITFNEFIEPKIDNCYQNKIMVFVLRAIDLKIIQKELIELPYCTLCNEILVDAQINGICPFCEAACQGVCEHCGIAVPPFALKNVICTRCNSLADKKWCSVYTFELTKYLPAIKNELDHLILSPRLRDLVDRVLLMKDFKILLTYPGSSHGLTLLGSDQILHVWFEMAAHYEQFALSQKFWIHCFGFDNSFFYLLFIPSLLRAMNPMAKLPDAVITNDFLQLEGSKFSTSREHALWADEVNDNVDHLRLYLTLYRPSAFAEDFSMEKYQHFSLNLETQLHQLKSRAKIVAKQNRDKVMLQKLIDCNRATRDMEFFLSPTIADLRHASRNLVTFMDLTLQSKDTGPSERMMLHTLATIMSPFMPQEAEQLFILLEVNSVCWAKDWSELYAIT